MSPADSGTKTVLGAVERQQLLTMSDEALLRQCRVDVFFGSGRGGQKRNRTESAVRVTHGGTGLAVTCDETRSQHTNRMLALRKLRQEVALNCRCLPVAVWTGPWRPQTKSVAYAPWLAAVLDVLEDTQYRLAETAERFGLSTGRLVRDLGTDPVLWQAVNAGRKRWGHPPLRRS
jgi:hypothetical protein